MRERRYQHKKEWRHGYERKRGYRYEMEREKAMKSKEEWICQRNGSNGKERRREYKYERIYSLERDRSTVGRGFEEGWKVW